MGPFVCVSPNRLLAGTIYRSFIIIRGYHRISPTSMSRLVFVASKVVAAATNSASVIQEAVVTATSQSHQQIVYMENF